MQRTRGDPTLSSVSEHGRGNDIPSVHLRNTTSKDPMLNVRVDTSQDVCSPKKSSSSLEEGISAKKRSKQDPPSTDTIDDPGRSSKCSKSTSISEVISSGFTPAQQGWHIPKVLLIFFAWNFCLVDFDKNS